MSPDHETNAEKLTELLELKDQRISELETEVEAKITLIGKLERENSRIHEIHKLDRKIERERKGRT